MSYSPGNNSANYNNSAYWNGIWGSSWPSNPDNALNFNWPYNDLYFSKDCPGGDTVNLVPCLK